jgi:hypothetical protein
VFRHVVMFQWQPETPAADRAAAVDALREFGRQISELGRLSVGADAGVSPGNFDTVVVVDFASREDYVTYASDPRHLEVIATFIKPHLQVRAAVQYELVSEDS